jgi:hypothetical protein
LSVADDGNSRALKIAAIAVAAVLAGGVLVAFLLIHHGSHKPSPSAADTPTHRNRTHLPQAKWRVRAFPSGVIGHVTRKNINRARRRGRRAVAAVENVYDALVLDPPDAERVIRAHFEEGAARAFLRTRARLPSGIRRVRTTRRRLQIGIDAKSAGKAVASVLVSFKGDKDSHRVKIRVRSTLWLERMHGTWKVVAWRGKQGPA